MSSIRMRKGCCRIKDISNPSSDFINESQMRDARPPIQQLMDVIPGLQQTIGGAIGEVKQAISVAKSAIDAIHQADGTAHSGNVQQNAIIDNMQAAEQADPSQSIITCTDHLPKVQQAYNDLLDIQANLNNAMVEIGTISRISAMQFL